MGQKMRFDLEKSRVVASDAFSLSLAFIITDIYKNYITY
jgi:hypothetical protein